MAWTMLAEIFFPTNLFASCSTMQKLAAEQSHCHEPPMAYIWGRLNGTKGRGLTPEAMRLSHPGFLDTTWFESNT